MTTERDVHLRFRLRLAASCVLLLGLAMMQSPGLLVPDTKLDLAVAPGDFLARALHLWDAEAAFGQLQNQAYGYLWPMGPFFLLGSLLDIPGWVVQRLWMALVMCVALTGAAKVSRALGVRSDLAALLAGFAYALSPRMLTTLGPISIEAWPSALAPWVLLPLVIGSQRGSARRAAALSALAVAMVGGVNAAAAAAALPLGILWILTRSPGPRRRVLMVWWPVFTALGTLWWLVPLFVMGAYSPPFLDYIESAANTTFSTPLFDALRGTSNWVPYVDQRSRAGNDLIRQFYLPINSGVVLFLGLVGLVNRRNPHRFFLGLSVLVGLFLVTMGHIGNVQGWWAPELQSLLDGMLAPLRNVHKFDPVVRLPLVLGLAWVVDHALGHLGARGDSALEHPQVTPVQRFNVLVVVGTAVLAVFGAAMPAVAGRIAPAGGFVSLPDYWTKAAAWLGAEKKPGVALLAPGSSFGDYLWGFSRDEPFQPLATSPWAVRNAVPLVPPGNIRMLDAIEQRLAQGLPSAGLATYLRRAGVTHLVVRNDLARTADVPDPVLVHQAINGSPGLRRVRTFGPSVGGEAHLVGDKRGRVLVNGGWQAQYPAIEVFKVVGDRSFAVTSDIAPVIVGGPEDLLDLADLGILRDEPTQLASDIQGPLDPSAPLVLTDGLRAVERHFGRVHDGASATLVPGQERRLGNPTRDYLLDSRNRWSTVARIDGARALRASSSMSDSSAIGVVQRGQLPYAAVDGDLGTAWAADYRTDQPAWWEVDFEAAQPVDSVTVTAGPDRREVVRVRTRHTLSKPITLSSGASRVLRVGEASSPWLRVEDASGRVGNRLTLAEVTVPGLDVRRSLVLPSLPTKWKVPDRIVLRAVGDARTGCATIDGATRCVAGRDVAPEEPAGFRRSVSLPEQSEFTARLDVRARAGEALDQLLLSDQPIGVSGSTQGNPDPRSSPLAALDGDEGTTWTASLSDVTPTLRLNWIGKHRVRGLDLSVAADTAARLPEELVVTWPGGRRDVRVNKRGEARFPPVRTDQLAVRVKEAEPATSLGFDSAGASVPVGIGEMRVLGLPLVPIVLPTQQVRFPCGSGPDVWVNRHIIRTSVTASPVELYGGATVPAKLCTAQDVSLDAGENQVDALGSDAFVPTALVLSRTGMTYVPPPHPVSIAWSDPARMTIDLDDPARLVTVRENRNLGWRAVQRGRVLEPVTVDGWQQGWRLSGSSAALHVTFQPDRDYRWGLLGGLAAVLVLAVLCAVPRRRWAETPGGPLGSGVPPLPVVGGVVVLAGGSLAGWLGALVAGGSFVLASVLNRRAPEVGPWILGGAVLPAAVAYAFRPWGGSGGWAGGLDWPHYLVVVACAAVLAWPAGGGRRPRSFRRIPGRSTRR